MANFESVKVNVRGTILFPRTEDGKTSYAIKVEQKEIEKIAKALSMTLEDVNNLFIHEAEEKDEASGEVIATHKVINTKTVFTFPVFGIDGNALEMKPKDIYHKAEAVVSLLFKEYTYKKKTGITNYVNGMILIKNGEAPKGGFATMFADIDKEDLELPF